MEVAASVSLLRAPPSWALAATMTLSDRKGKEDKVPEATTAVHAKCASGVPFLMSAVDETTVLSERLEQEPHHSPTLTRWDVCRETLFGRFCAEDTCATFPFFVTS